MSARSTVSASPLSMCASPVSPHCAAIVGSRLDVWQVIETIRQNDNSVEEAADYLGKPVHMIQACVAYYADYQDEIDEWTARAKAFAEREEARWRRQQQLLA